MMEGLNGVRVVKMETREADEEARVARVVAQRQRHVLSGANARGLAAPVSEALTMSDRRRRARLRRLAGQPGPCRRRRLRRLLRGPADGRPVPAAGFEPERVRRPGPGGRAAAVRRAGCRAGGPRPRPARRPCASPRASWCSTACRFAYGDGRAGAERRRPRGAPRRDRRAGRSVRRGQVHRPQPDPALLRHRRRAR